MGKYWKYLLATPRSKPLLRRNGKTQSIISCQFLHPPILLLARPSPTNLPRHLLRPKVLTLLPSLLSPLTASPLFPKRQFALRCPFPYTKKQQHKQRNSKTFLRSMRTIIFLIIGGFYIYFLTFLEGRKSKIKNLTLGNSHWKSLGYALVCDISGDPPRFMAHSGYISRGCNKTCRSSLRPGAMRFSTCPFHSSALHLTVTKHQDFNECSFTKL